MRNWMMQNWKKMQNWKRAILLLGVGAVSLLIIYAIFQIVFLDFFVDLWWFQSLQYGGYFLLRQFYRFLIGGGLTLVLFLLFFFHFWIASSYLGFNRESTLNPRLQKTLRFFQIKSLKFYTPFALILAVVVALPLYRKWELTLMFLFGSRSGIKDPAYGHDISFYLFDYPIYQLIQQELLVTAILLFAFIAVLYFVEHRLLPTETRKYPLGAKIHLAVLWGFVVLFVVLGFMLDRFSLLYENRHEPVFFGPGFIEMRYHLPLIWMAILAFLSTTVSALVLVFRRNKVNHSVYDTMRLSNTRDESRQNKATNSASDTMQPSNVMVVPRQNKVTHSVYDTIRPSHILDMFRRNKKALSVWIRTRASHILDMFRRNKITISILIISMILLAGALVLRDITFIPNLITRVFVKPNPVDAAKPFIKNNIEATLHAYGLDDIKTIDFKVTLTPENDLEQWTNEVHLHNIPVWDRHLLKDVYEQLQGIRTFYSIPSVDEDRYSIGGKEVQVNIAARELNTAKLPMGAKKWENQYLRYTHGYGAVITPAAQSGEKAFDWYIRDLNMHTTVGLTTKEPDIYYGLEKLERAIVPNKLTVVGFPGTRFELTKEYAGNGGIPIPSLFRKWLFSIYFKDEKILFSTNISKQSKILFRRNIKERIATLVPYLSLDSDPYLVLTSNRLYWVQDAYTISDKYPVSKSTNYNFNGDPDARSERRFNYIRNSVKVIVDAYNGNTSFYIADPGDPIIQAYKSAYPGVFKHLDEMPDELQTHLRYPRDLFYIQMQIYARYHQIKPELFYQQADTWQVPLDEKEELKPYYLNIELQGLSRMENFVLISPMTPIRVNNLSAIAIAGLWSRKNNEGEYSQKIAVYKLETDVQVNGPSQVSALVAQNPEISEQFALWDMRGSKVVTGRMIILPIENSILYVVPVYLISTKMEIPELIRIIVSVGDETVMEKSLKECFKKLEEKLKAIHQ